MRKILGLVLLLLFATIAVSGRRSSVEYDGSVDFSEYRTYAWREGTPARRSGVQELIESAIDRELGSKALVRVENGADLYVITHALVDTHSMENLADPDYWDFWTGVTDVDAYKLGSGTLVIDLIDAESERAIWRGVMSKAIADSMEKNRKGIDKLVRKLLEEYPPAP